ncbi:monooxygenase [Diaporthe sp. PMI_573]|nr:monooxygenase [Diaporthaceae sp. PMI_573]
MADTPLQIAIIGAGIAGLTAALSIRRILPDQHIRVTIYEKATELREIGASIGLNPSGLRILDRLGVNAALDGSISFRQRGEWPMIYRHWLLNEEIGHDEYKGQVEEKHRMGRFHRAHMQAALVQAVREAGGVEIHLGARITDVKVGSEGAPAVVYFENGDHTKADLVIGADGIHSRVRRSFASRHELKWTGQVAFRTAFDVSLVNHIDGLPDDAIFWVGHERTLFASRLGKNQYTVVGSYIADPADPNSPFHNTKWSGPGDTDFLRSLYKGWHPVVESIVNAVPYTKTYPNHAGTALPALSFNGRIALLGDAAHTHGGAFAAGGSLAINDAYALALSLAHVWPKEGTPTREQLRRALALYDETRRPLVTRVLDLVHGAAQKRRWTGANADNGKKETDEELRSRIASRPDMTWLTEHDVEAEFQGVILRERNGTDKVAL